MILNTDFYNISASTLIDCEDPSPVEKAWDSSFCCCSKSVNSSRRVVFVEEKNKEYGDASDNSANWYSAEEIEAFRCAHEEMIHFALEEQQRANDENTSSVYTVLREIYRAARSSKANSCFHQDASSLLTFELEQQLNKLASSEQALDVLGLESKIVFEIKRQTRQARLGLWDEIRDIQFEGEFMHDEDDDDEDWSEEMREAASRYSHSSVLFAQLLAMAIHKSDVVVAVA